MKVLIYITSFFIIASVYSQERDVIWQNALGGEDDDEATSIARSMDGGYILTGVTRSNDGDVSGNHGGADVWVAKLSDTGNLEWQKCLGGTDGELGWSIVPTIDEGYILAGQTLSNDGDVFGNHGGFDAWVVKLSSTGDIQWQKSLGGSEWDRAYSIIQTSDGGYIMGGITSSNDGDVSGNHGEGDVWVVKLSNSGEIDWQKCFGGTEWEDGYSILQTSDGGYIIAGDTISNDGDISGNHGYVDVWVVKLSSTGELEWQKTYGGSASDVARSIAHTSDGGYILSCDTWSSDGDVTGTHGFRDVWILKISNTGEIEWQKALGGSGYEYAHSIVQTVDGGYIFAGATDSNDGDVYGNHSYSGYDDVWVGKLSQDGVLEWQQCLGGSYWEVAFSIIETSEDNYVLTGFTHSNDGDISGNHSNENDVWVVTMNSILDIDDVLSENLISISPNPVKNDITINNIEPGSYNIIIYDLLGREQYKYATTVVETHLKMKIPQLPSGTYFINITETSSLKKTFTKKILIQ